MKIDFFKIKAAAPLKHSHPGFDTFVTSMEKLVRETIPESVIAIHETSHFIPVDSSFERLGESLPILTLLEESDAPCTLSLTVLTREENTHGVGLFLCDMISQKLFPGKKMPISFLRSLSFKFVVKPKQRFYIIEFFIEVETLKELYTIKKNFPRFEEEVRLTVLGVERARKVVLAKRLSPDEKRMVLSENLESLIKKPSGPTRKTLFTDMHTLLLKAIYDHNPNKIPDHILPHIDAKPETFDHFIFKEMEKLSILFHEAFASLRSLSHLSKTISYLYLFRKILTYTTRTKPHERHLTLKLLSTSIQNTPTLALLIGVNFIDPSEVLEVEDVLSSLFSLVPQGELLPGSNIINGEEKEGIRLLYFEIQKKEKTPFTLDEIKLLKKRLPKEVKSHIHPPKSLPAPIDEEKMRSIISLSKELSSVHNHAEVVIQFHNAGEAHYDFSVILARVRKANDEELQLFSIPPVTIRKQERKVAGILDKRFIKEIYLYEMRIQKEERDIAKARADLFAFIRSHVYNLHDFNGGMVNRKYENLQAFKNLLKDPLHDGLIENYFYSITPPYLQSLTPPNILKKHFELFLRALDKDF